MGSGQMHSCHGLHVAGCRCRAALHVVVATRGLRDASGRLPCHLPETTTTQLQVLASMDSTAEGDSRPGWQYAFGRSGAGGGAGGTAGGGGSSSTSKGGARTPR